MAIRLLRTCIIVVALTCVPSASGQDSPAAYSGPKDRLHIYILVGQSNMSGRAKVETQDRQLPKNLFLLDGHGKWVQATHPFIQYTNVPNGADVRVITAKGASGLNLGQAFAQSMLAANPDASIGLVVNSQGGSAIATWKPGGKNYVKTLERIRPILDTGSVKGILWHQGESDQKLAEAYLDPLAQVIEQFRKDLKAPELPFVAGQIAPQTKQTETIEAFNQALLKLPTRVPHTAVVRTDHVTSNDTHFNSAETRELGQRYAKAMLKLQATRR